MDNERQKANIRTTRKTLLVVIGMFAFGYALVPLYSVICDVFGLNGRFIELQKTEQTEYVANVEKRIDTTRKVRVEFLTTLNQKLNWEFRARQNTIDVHPGKVNEVMFYAKNLTDRKVIAQAIPSISPGNAAKYFSKMECFCFSQQTFEPGEAREMPLRFYVDPNLPERVKTISLGYTFFDTDRKLASK
ncbi:MAG: cytochrome c oxidase assembly protein [Gammaproteobacteria bacterium]|nr:cytochrome c oxidase assembly protein [Gammaproteobacteria bacterium]MCW8988187.1 cytochrome c oxidase assembly protein [Gammaproteobacteria bacterium]MCW9030190.1 cytochrome c oxidase assembly protein [Gammaproteobacteria bacterium]